ncbi:MAG: NAD-dependent protein deacylase [Clostridium sp.]|nr:NAD-dependent protein deacylase [Clostridium sp.]
MNPKIAECVDLIKTSNNIVVLTGAGMSTESGIPDFRSETGIYNMVPEKVLSYKYFLDNPKEFYDFIKRYFLLTNVEPNIGHKVLAEWENKGLIKHIISQNIDGLHQKAGSKNVLEVHGTMETATCQNPGCRKEYIMKDLLNLEGEFYYCHCKNKYGLIKPDVVLFDEPVDKINDAYLLMRDADLLVALGTSLNVYPVASLPKFLREDKHMIIINYMPTQYDNRKNCINIRESIGGTLSQVNEVITALEDYMQDDI